MANGPIRRFLDDLAGRRDSVESVVRRCLDRIERWDGTVHAWVRVDANGALAQAKALDDELAAGRALRPLHGVPVGIKDIVDVEGWPTLVGSPAPFDTEPRHDAPLVTRLRLAGAVVLGKTVTTAFASFDPSITANPWDPSRTPGGSSSGSAAAVACGMALAAVASQTGGSTIRPAAYCGVASFKPTFRAPQPLLEGFLPLAPSLDHPGMIASTLDDLTFVWPALIGSRPVTPRTEPPRIGRLRGLFDERTDPAFLSAIEDAVVRLRHGGARVEDVDPGVDFAQVLEDHLVLMAVEVAEVHAETVGKHPEAYPEKIRGLMDRGLSTPRAQLKAIRERKREAQAACDRALAGFDAWLTPATPGPPPNRSTTGDPAFNSIWSFVGLPTASAPLGLSAEGLPLSLQWIGARGADLDLLAVAAWCENVLDVAPLVPPLLAQG